MKVFIIHSSGMTEDALKYAARVEARGYETYVPLRDTDQSNVPNILSQNRAGLEWADEVIVFWDLSSLGSVFDLGMAYAMRKPVYVMKVKKHHWVKELISHERKWIFREGEYVE